MNVDRLTFFYFNYGVIENELLGVHYFEVDHLKDIFYEGLDVLDAVNIN